MIKKYTKRMLGAELILKLEEENNLEEISQWADHIRHKYIGQYEDPDIDAALQDLSAMSFGPEFEMTIDELRKLAITLIQS